MDLLRGVVKSYDRDKLLLDESHNDSRRAEVRDAFVQLLDVIANGDIERFVAGNKTVVLTNGEYEAVLALTKNGQKHSWLLTGWDKIPTDENGKVSTNTVSTQTNPTFSREDLGAVIESATNLRNKYERENGIFSFSEEKENFDRMRERAVERNGIVIPDLAEKEIDVVSVPRHPFKGSGKDVLQQAERWAKENMTGTHRLTDSDGKEIEYRISNKAIEKYLSQSASGKSSNLGAHLGVLTELPKVNGNSIEAEVHPDYKKGNDGVREPENGVYNDVLVHRFYGAVEVDGEVYRVKTTIKENTNRKAKAHSYEVTEIELLNSEESSNQMASKGSEKILTALATTKIGNNSVMRKISGEDLLRGFVAWRCKIV